MGDAGLTGAASSPEEQHLKQRMELQSRARGGADWFFWIAGLSLINSIVALTGGEWGFVVGLGFTTIVDYLASEMAEAGTALLVLLNVPLLALFAVCGVKARNGSTGAFWFGMIVYGLDALLCIWLEMYLPFGFHLFALYFIFQGLKATQELKALDAGGALQPA